LEMLFDDFVQRQLPVVMGPCVRRDDIGCWATRLTV
jgi:hypothetical protein